MNRSLQRKIPPGAIFWITLPFLFLPSVGRPQTAIAAPMRILQSAKYSLGDHAITYNRVVPPPAVAAPVPPVTQPSAVAASVPQSSNAPVTFKPIRPLVVTATVYNHSVSDLSWSDDSGVYHAYSNIDFNLLLGVMEVDSVECDYILILSVINSAAPAGPLANPIPSRSQFPAYSAYILAKDNPAAPSAQAVDGLGSLGEYLDANRTILAAQYAARLAAALAAGKAPSRPADIVVNFWKIGSAGAGKGGGQ